jgi:integrase
MSIKRIGKTWYIDIATPAGRLRQSLKTTDRKRAQQLQDKLRHEMWDAVHLGKAPTHTWGDAVAEYKRLGNPKKNGAKKKSSETDKYRLKRLALYIKDTLPLSQINNKLVNRIRDGEIRAGKAPATVNRVLAMLSAVMRVARNREMTTNRPDIVLCEVNNFRDKVLTREEESALLNVLPEHWKPLFRFSILTGMRQYNAFHLRWEQVNEELRTVTIEGNEMKGGHTWTRALGAAEIAIIRNQKGNRSPYVFTHPDGRPIHRLDNRTWKSWCCKAGVAGATWHTLRHTFATRFMRAGGSIYELIKLGGWSRPDVPLRRYAHLDVSDQHRAIERTSQPIARGLS